MTKCSRANGFEKKSCDDGQWSMEKGLMANSQWFLENGQWWRTAWGWSMLTRSADSQQWLPYDHCDLSATRDHVADLLATGTHPGLVLNYDRFGVTATMCQNSRLRVVEIDVEYIFHLVICQGDEAPKLLLQVLKCKL